MGQLMTTMAKSPARWISQEAWRECQQLSDSISSFSGICSHIVHNPQYWLTFSTTNEPFSYLGQSETVEEDKGKIFTQFRV